MVAQSLSTAFVVLSAVANVAFGEGVSSTNAEPGQGSSSDGWYPRGKVALKDLSVGPKGKVIGISKTTGHILHHRAGANLGDDHWVKLRGLSTVSNKVRSSCSGAAWSLAPDGKLYRMRDFKGTFEHFAAPTPFKTFGVGQGVDIWALDNNGKPWRYDAATKNWASTEAKLETIEVACGGRVVGTTGDKTVWNYVAATGKWKAAAKGVTQFAPGPRRSLIIDTSRRVFKVPKDANGRELKPINMKRTASVVAVGPNPRNRMWMLDPNGMPFEYTGYFSEAKLNVAERAALEAKQGGTWTVTKGMDNVLSFGAGADKDLYAVTNSGAVMYRSGARDAKFMKIKAPAGIRKISVGCDGATVFAIGEDNKVFKYAGSGRWNLFSEKLRQVSVGADSKQVWGVNMGNRLVRWSPKTRKFVVARGVNVKNVAANCDGSVWVSTRRGRLFERSLRNPRLRYRGRGVRKIATSPSGTYILDGRHFLYRYRRPKAGEREGKRNWKLLHKQLRSVDVDAKGNLFGRTVDGHLASFASSAAEPSEFGWKSLKASLDDVCLGTASSLYGLDGGTVLRYTPARTWAVVAGIRLAQISCGCDGSIVGVKGPGLVYRFRSPRIGWERLPNSESIRSVAMGKNANKMFGVNHAGQPVQWDSGTSTWTELKGSVSSVAATCSDELWGVAENGDVLSLDEVTGHWAKVGTGARSVAAGRGVYVIGKNYQLFKYDTERKHNRWVSLGPARRVAAGDDGAVVAITRDREAVWVTKGTMIAPGPEVPPTLQHDPTADLPPPEPDMATVSSFHPGEEPQVGAMDDMDRILGDGSASAQVKHAIAAQNEGKNPSDTADPEPYRPNGLDPDDPDSKGPSEGPSTSVSQSFDPATDNTKPVDESDPR